MTPDRCACRVKAVGVRYPVGETLENGAPAEEPAEEEESPPGTVSVISLGAVKRERPRGEKKEGATYKVDWPRSLLGSSVKKSNTLKVNATVTLSKIDERGRS